MLICNCYENRKIIKRRMFFFSRGAWLKSIIMSELILMWICFRWTTLRRRIIHHFVMSLTEMNDVLVIIYLRQVRFDLPYIYCAHIWPQYLFKLPNRYITGVYLSTNQFKTRGPWAISLTWATTAIINSVLWGHKQTI